MSIESPPLTPSMSIDSPPPPTPPAHVDSSSFDSSIRIRITMSNHKKAGSDSDGSSSSPHPPYPKKPRVLEGRSLGVDDDGDCDMPTLGEEMQEMDDDVDLPQEQEQEEDDDRGMSRRGIKLCLPSPLELCDEKEILLENRNLCCELQVPTSMDAELTTQLEDLVKASRILHLNKIELYFVEDGQVGPFSPRNELESLNAILSLINSSLPDAKFEKKEVLESLKSSICGKIDEVASEYLDEETFKEYDELGNEVLKWGRCHGIKAKFNITCCSETGKGAEASEDIGIGDTVLEVPYSCIVWEDIVEKSNLYDDMKKNDLSSREMFLLWCMNERHVLVSEHKEYFQMLPKEFKTGLSFSNDGLQELCTSTPLGWELREIEQCLQLEFDKLHSTFSWIQENYTFENYRWAYQLLDTNGMEVVSDAKTKLCLIPVSEFLNHSLCPHILHHETVERESVNYGSADHKSKFLIFRALRPCRKGEQCYISYGNLSGHEFIKSYGFLPKGLNPYDVLYLDWDWFLDNAPATEHSDDFSWTTPMVRQFAFSETYTFPARLMDQLYAKFGVAKDHKPEDIVPIIDALKKLKLYLFQRKIKFRRLRSRSKRKEVGWDVKLAWEYHKLTEERLCAASAYCLNSIEYLARKYGLFRPEDCLLIPYNKMGAICVIQRIGPTGLPIALDFSPVPDDIQVKEVEEPIPSWVRDLEMLC